MSAGVEGRASSLRWPTGAAVNCHAVTPAKHVPQCGHTRESPACCQSRQPCPRVLALPPPCFQRLDVRDFPGGRTLQILSVQEDDAGRYSCVATNEAGEMAKHYELKVYSKCSVNSPCCVAFLIRDNSGYRLCSLLHKDGSKGSLVPVTTQLTMAKHPPCSLPFGEVALCSLPLIFRLVSTLLAALSCTVPPDKTAAVCTLGEVWWPELFQCALTH